MFKIKRRKVASLQELRGNDPKCAKQNEKAKAAPFCLATERDLQNISSLMELLFLVEKWPRK